VKLVFGPDAIEAIAEIANLVNDTTENIGARRLHTVMNARWKINVQPAASRRSD